MRTLLFVAGLGIALLSTEAAAICNADGLCCKLPQVLNPETQRCEAMDACPAGTVRNCLTDVPAVCTCKSTIMCAVRLQWAADKPHEAAVTDVPHPRCDRAAMELAIAAALARLLGAP